MRFYFNSLEILERAIKYVFISPDDMPNLLKNIATVNIMHRRPVTPAIIDATAQGMISRSQMARVHGVSDRQFRALFGLDVRTTTDCWNFIINSVPEKGILPLRLIKCHISENSRAPPSRRVQKECCYGRNEGTWGFLFVT